MFRIQKTFRKYVNDGEMSKFHGFSQKSTDIVETVHFVLYIMAANRLGSIHRYQLKCIKHKLGCKQNNLTLMSINNSNTDSSERQT